MKNESITGGFKKLKENLSGMTFRGKVEHLWTYYRSWVIVACAIVLILCIFATSLINLKTKILVAGASVNVILQSDAEAYMTEDLAEILKTGKGREEAVLTESYTTDSLEETYYLQQNMYALIAGKDIDYVILDKNGIDLIAAQNPFMNLENVFSEEELKQFDVLNVTNTESGEVYPGLIDITDWAIVQQGTNPDVRYYFGVIANTTRLEAVKTAFAHMQNYGK